jgi:hypothetical protein
MRLKWKKYDGAREAANDNTVVCCLLDTYGYMRASPQRQCTNTNTSKHTHARTNPQIYVILCNV